MCGQGRRILERGLKAQKCKLRKKELLRYWNFGFGIQEHINLAIKCDPSTGVLVWAYVWCWVGQVSASQKGRTGCIGDKHRLRI